MSTTEPTIEEQEAAALADTMQREDAMDEAWHAGGCPGSPPRRDTCHPCGDWADHTHDVHSGARVDLTDAELKTQIEDAMDRAIMSDRAYDTDEGAWGLYGRLLDRARERQAEHEEVQP